ncbi:ATP-dependent DNA helicase RecG [Desulfosporosinus meridiei]|uniref:ATP-dependent DNA helicase RecG n=1 Tax=Desulfosporosinus meridiei (strain ATCC BAA-275 / DSM 13257 / KCTC 12902 / NCIMB 13706 / S10) TaxID=768704 RepID=J7IV37_DESMD|nr:ATP-dependent DNA helicase RecG [Desulfosporosinus meridiei]AFQ45595.1 ATP-dependent DNA helicase RecG [Desulfosporosinus meridiei DSM 13257]
MKLAQVQLVLSNFQRALVAEERQGFTNAGVLGGFNAFLKGIIPRLEKLFPGKDLELLSKLAQNYSSLSPLRRREAFSELRRFMTEITGEVEQTATDSVLAENERTSSKKGFSENGIPKRDNPLMSLEEKRNFDVNEYGSFRQMPRKTENLQDHGKLNTSQGRQFTNSSLEDQKSSKSKTIAQKDNPLQFLKGVGPERAKLLGQLGIHTIKDLLEYYPRRYEDRRKRMISELKDGELATVEGKVVAGNVLSGKLKVVKLSIEQSGRLLQATWFNQPFILKQYPVGTQVIVTGKVNWQQQTPELLATDIEKVNVNSSSDNSNQGQTILPVYPETARLSSKVIRSLMQGVLKNVEREFPEILPSEVSGDWMERSLAHREIHFPKTYTSLSQARERLVWEEVLFLQLAVAGLRQGIIRTGSPSLTGGEELLQSFYKGLPFELTLAQQRVIQEIFNDLSRSQGMARLVQGDVGSGKTAVAMAALLRAVGSGYQGAMMAPTEILAIQHFNALEKVFTPLGICVVCLLGSQSKSSRESILEMIASGKAHVAVGTHALIQETVVFKALGLAVTDEQHRFGVRQRSLLQSKGESPHVLVLTATPIPRTLALTLYGDLQLSILDEMPVGRKSIITRKLTERARPKMEKFLDEQINLGRQIYVVCPLVEESETLDIISATQKVTELRERFPDHRISLLHGKMKGLEKEEIMAAFNAGNIDILVATTVVEVGVNVPNASVMVIESAERFGLAQLHQLRGRVGRGSEQSYCFLMSGGKGSQRLDILCQTEDGFKIAEEDMRLRGTGELLGIRQHGLAELRLADLSRDGHLVEKAYQMAQKILQSPERYDLLLKEVQLRFPPEDIGVH